MWKKATLVVTTLLAVMTVLFVRSQLEIQKLNTENRNCWAVSLTAVSEWAVLLEEETRLYSNCLGELDRVNTYLVSSSITQDFQHFPLQMEIVQPKSIFLPLPSGGIIQHIE